MFYFELRHSFLGLALLYMALFVMASGLGLHNPTFNWGHASAAMAVLYVFNGWRDALR